MHSKISPSAFILAAIFLAAFFFPVSGVATAFAREPQDVNQAKPQANQAPAQSPSQPKQVEQNQPPNVQLPQDKPLGASGPSRDKNKPTTEDADFMVIRDRWRIGMPEDPRLAPPGCPSKARGTD